MWLIKMQAIFIVLKHGWDCYMHVLQTQVDMNLTQTHVG